MTYQSAQIKLLVKELEDGKKFLLAEYERSIKAIDNTIHVLQTSKIDITEAIQTGTIKRKRGRPFKGSINLKSIVRKAASSGLRGRPKGSQSAYQGNLTQAIYEIVIKKNHFLHSREIADILSRQLTIEDRASFGKKLSVLLASLKRQGKLTTYSSGSNLKNVFWGLPMWINKNGSMATGREPRSN
jgi:hypothetical protein